jgi:hypothetical protein
MSGLHSCTSTLTPACRYWNHLGSELLRRQPIYRCCNAMIETRFRDHFGAASAIAPQNEARRLVAPGRKGRAIS